MNYFIKHTAAQKTLFVIIGFILLYIKPYFFIFYILGVAAVLYYKKHYATLKTTHVEMPKITEKELEKIKVKCPLCKDIIPANAIRCSHCAGDLGEISIKTKIYEQATVIQKRGRVVGITIIVLIVATAAGVYSTDGNKQTSSTYGNIPNEKDDRDPEPIITDKDKEVAQKKLNNILDLSEKAGLVISYEFSESARVIYVGNVWYTQTVKFKEDFLGSIAQPLKEVSGYHHFKVLDAYSNEKVGEVTAFSGSIKVYK